jgi:hypothetical protein
VWRSNEIGGSDQGVKKVWNLFRLIWSINFSNQLEFERHGSKVLFGSVGPPLCLTVTFLWVILYKRKPDKTRSNRFVRVCYLYILCLKLKYYIVLWKKGLLRRFRNISWNTSIFNFRHLEWIKKTYLILILLHNYTFL